MFSTDTSLISASAALHCGMEYLHLSMLVVVVVVVVAVVVVVVVVVVVESRFGLGL